MKFALIGYGKMGRLLEERLREKKHEVVAVVEPFFTEPVSLSGTPVYRSLEDALKGNLRDADAAIEFTHPDAAEANLLFLAREKIPVVTGTTGWYVKLPGIRQAVEASGSSLVWASNFSLGINLFYRVAAYTAKLMDPFREYDVAGVETHHNNKADSPSGTAKTLVELVLARMTRKKKAVYQTLDRKPEAEELHYASVRVGSAPGVHSLVFDSAADTIELVHTARNREGLVSGAVLAAEWLTARKRSGVFTVDDVLEEILK
jgi:4-hydroxy-tetrahydrodipicolinate reductase